MSLEQSKANVIYNLMFNECQSDQQECYERSEPVLNRSVNVRSRRTRSIALVKRTIDKAAISAA